MLQRLRKYVIVVFLLLVAHGIVGCLKHLSVQHILCIEEAENVFGHRNMNKNDVKLKIVLILDSKLVQMTRDVRITLPTY